MKKILLLSVIALATPALAMGSAPVTPPATPVIVPEPAPIAVVTPPVAKPAATTTAKKTTTQKKTTAKKPPPTSNVRPEVKAPAKVTRKAVLSKSKQPAK